MTRTFSPEPFGRYFLIDRMAVGGMAEIFRATMLKDGGFQRIVVIKRILEHLNDEEQFIDMFKNEARITVTLTHPNIVQIYDFDRFGKHFYIAMEYIQGKDLRALLKAMTQKGKLLPVDLAAFVAHEAARGLHFAHAKADLQGSPLGIVHRDVSPANLLVSYDGSVKVADFGIARAEANLGHTRTGTLKGKFEYMSPEQIDLIDLDGRSDLFALGVVLYNLLTGRRLFKGKNDLETLENVRSAPFDPPSRFNPDVPARLDEIVMKALARDRENRYATGRGLAEDLAEFLYPVSPDQMRESLAATMDEYFASEKAEEQRTLEEGTRIARELRGGADAASDDLELDDATVAGADKIERTDTAVAAPSSTPWLAGAAFFGVAWLVVVLLWLFMRPPDSGIQASSGDPTRFGSIHLDIDPPIPVELWVNGVDVAEGTGKVGYDRLQPGSSVQIEVRSPGYSSYLTVFEPAVGQVLRSTIHLAKKVEVEAPPDVAPDLPPPVAAEAPGYHLETNPPGATVFIDGEEIGTTPLDWKDGEPGKTYDVDFEKPSYQSLMKKMTFPRTGGLATKAVQLLAIEGKGTVIINIVNDRAEVFVDGESLGPITMISRQLKAGNHKITAVFKDGRKDVEVERFVTLERDQEMRVPIERP